MTGRAPLLVFRNVGLTRHTLLDEGEVLVTLDLASLDELDAQAARRRATAADAAVLLSV